MEAAAELDSYVDKEKIKEKRDKERQKERARVEKDKENDEGNANTMHIIANSPHCKPMHNKQLNANTANQMPILNSLG